MSAHAKRYPPHAPRYAPVVGKRGEFTLVERRRREYVGQAAARPLPASVLKARQVARTPWIARAGASAILASTSLALAYSLFLALATPSVEPIAAQRSATPSRQRVATRTFTHRPRIAAAAHAPERPVSAHAIASRALAIARAPAPKQKKLIIAQPSATQIAPPHPFEATGSGLSLEAQPWQLTADGTWRTEVVAYFADTSGSKEPRLRADVDFEAGSAEVVGLDPWIHQTPAATVTTQAAHPIDVSATAVEPSSGSATLTLPPPPTDVSSFAGVARAVGPHLVAVGWTPLAQTTGVRGYRVYRRAADAGQQALVALLSAGGHSWRDAHAQANASYEYTIVADLPGGPARAQTQTVDTPGPMPESSIDAIAGKGMFFFFSPDTNDSHSYELFDPDTVVAQAVKAGVSDIELRLSRGTFEEAANPHVRAWLDRFIDGAAGAGIKLIAWSVPRRNAADDVAESIAMASYRTPAGNGFAGLSLDLEPGDNYMGHGAAARERIADYMEMARQAVGPDYLLIATVISPRLTHFTNDEYPYSRIARYASVMQPMEYWHHFRTSHEYAQADVTGNCADAVSLTRSLAGRHVPVNVAGQSTDLGRTGSPTPAELHWCLGAAQAAGAIGEMFFDYRGTSPDQWAAIESYRW
ncbi:MAG TPA: fibronectin type III domain-containing protein [Candidatus Eremiobacteraceae bacterium]|nr:fibronectin type III domain-containing protein [Candidatus Eremiobacteraceae bacterium]